MSINRANTGFYNYLGFKTVKEVSIGEDNPTWTEPPIIMDLVCSLHVSAWIIVLNVFHPDGQRIRGLTR